MSEQANETVTSDQKKGLSPLAYEQVPADEYPPYVAAEESMAELTLRAVLIGTVVGILFGAANAYLGLKVGMTVSPSIPAAVIGVATFKILGRGSILETNIIQTIGSAGGGIAAGVIFTLAGLYIWGLDPALTTVGIIALCGGILGVLFMIPLRRFLIAGEHGVLPYPEGSACAEVLVAGQQALSKVKALFAGLGIGAAYQALAHSRLFGLWPGEPTGRVPGFRGAEVGLSATPELLGVGYIIGPRIAAVMLAGGVIGWLVLIPLVYMFGGGLTAAVYPATDTLIADMAPIEIWSTYIRYIGAGAVAVGGFLTLIKSLPIIWSSFREGLSGLMSSEDTSTTEVPRTDQDLSPKVYLTGVVLVIIVLAVLPASIMPTGFVGAALIAIFAFFFVTVSSRIVGLIGSSSNPVSGMTIATLLVTALVWVALGRADMPNARFAVLAVGAVVCIAAAIAGDTSQDLKTGFLVGATPKRQQIAEIIGVAVTAFIIGSILSLLHQAYGIGSEELAAPQATIMTLVIDGVLQANLPWDLVLIGGVIAGIVELLGLPSLALAVGLYLPISLSTPIMVGGIIRGALERTMADDVDRLRSRRERGVLYASGLIAGAALIGVLAAGFVALSQLYDPEAATWTSQLGFYMTEGLAWMQSLGANTQAAMGETGGQILSLVLFTALAATLVYQVFWAGRSGKT